MQELAPLIRLRYVALLNSRESKSAKSAYSPSSIALAFQNGVDCCNFVFNRFSDDDQATSCKNLVNVSPVTPEFKRLKDIHFRLSTL